MEASRDGAAWRPFRLWPSSRAGLPFAARGMPELDRLMPEGVAVTVAVTTPTGHVGSQLVRMLVQSGVRPRLLLRHPDRLDPELRDHVELAVGDQRDADYVVKATRGAEAVYWVHPDDWSLPDPDADAERTGEGLAAAMRLNRIPRVVFQSSIGAEMRHGAGFIDGLARIEQRLDAAREETGAAVLHLRCGLFMTNLLMDLDALRAGWLTTTWPLQAQCRGLTPATSPPSLRCVCSPRTGPGGRCRRCTGRRT